MTRSCLRPAARSRDLPVPGRELAGIHFAMDYLYQRTRFVASEYGPEPTVPQPPAASRSARPVSMWW